MRILGITDFDATPHLDAIIALRATRAILLGRRYSFLFGSSVVKHGWLETIKRDVMCEAVDNGRVRP